MCSFTLLEGMGWRVVTVPLIINVGASWGCVVSFTTPPHLIKAPLIGQGWPTSPHRRAT
jgi:hypothetical protein